MLTMGSCLSKNKTQEEDYVSINELPLAQVNENGDQISEDPYSSDDPHIYSQLLLSNYILVVAIDFGTSYSGYAFSFRHDYERDKLKISTNLWPHNSGLSPKAPSAVLIGPDHVVKSFGYEAQSKYNELVECDKAEGHYYFEKFKMAIYSAENLCSNTIIKDVTGKEMLAVDVFGLVIGYLREHLLTKLQSHDTKATLAEDTIQYILTVPAIWSDKAKAFMRLAAEKGGIRNKHLMLALEPEVASLYCRHISQSISLYGTSPTTVSLDHGTKYLVLDIGGGTVDVTAHEIQQDGTLREMYQASGGSWGGTYVDEEFRKFLVTLFSYEVISEAFIKYPNDMLDLMLDFEMKKRTFKPGETEHVVMKCPACLFIVFEEKNGKSVSNYIQENDPVPGVRVVRDKFLISSKTFEAFYDDVVYKLLMHLRKLLLLEELSGIETVLLVGGFSDSEVIKSSILTNFPGIRIIHPVDCSMAVLKGAVLYGHDRRAISSRICKYSYGIGIHRKFKEGVHPPEKRRTISGVDICDDIFDIHLKLGEKVEITQPRLEKFYLAQNTGTNFAYLDVYASNVDLPQFVTDDSCNFLGSLMIELSGNVEEGEQKIFVSLHYIGTELGVLVRESGENGKFIKAKFDFLG